jgi:glycosyltransferase involved in cell wall biosynthesis
MPVRLKVIIPSYNSVQWIRKTLNSVSNQSYRHYDVCVIDDASQEKGQREIIEEYSQKYGWKAILREKNHGAVANIVEGIKSLHPTDEDVILLLDGDDWLYNHKVFEKIAQAYQDQSVYMTYGQFVTYPRWQIGLCRPFSDELLREKNFREVPWVFSHLRTFKYKLWKHIRDEDLRDSSGQYYKTAWDLALIYPMLEMTGGESVKFIEDILYVYNMDNPLNDHTAHAESQNRNAQYIRQLPSYPAQFSAKCVHYEERLLPKLNNYWITFFRKIITPKVYGLVWNKFNKMLKNR